MDGIYFGSYVNSSDVSVSLTGQSLTASSGSVSDTLATALSGLALAVSIGSVTTVQETSVAITGQSVSVSQGSITKSLIVSESGQEIVASVGSVVATPSYAITGQSVSVSQGSISASTASPISGQSVSVSSGSFSLSNTLALSGQNASVAIGSISGAVSASITGQNVTLNQDSITAQHGDINVAISGQSLTVSSGAIAAISEDVAAESHGSWFWLGNYRPDENRQVSKAKKRTKLTRSTDRKLKEKIVETIYYEKARLLPYQEKIKFADRIIDDLRIEKSKNTINYAIALFNYVIDSYNKHQEKLAIDNAIAEIQAIEEKNRLEAEREQLVKAEMNEIMFLIEII